MRHNASTKTFTLGNRTEDNLLIQSNLRPIWETNNAQYGESGTSESFKYGFAMLRDVERISSELELLGKEVKSNKDAIKTKADSEATRLSLENKYDKTGGELLGNLSIKGNRQIILEGNTSIKTGADTNAIVTGKQIGRAHV